MKQLIACCGLDCEGCDARIATVGNDNELREKTAQQWSVMNNAPEITAATINCMGCRADGAKFAYCSDYCEIRKCVNKKGFDTCGDCKELNSCQIVGVVFLHAPNAKENLLSSDTI
ncbi:DUF3795 domain-containing protein [uncultured Parabacteroides sp.]|uniref:DUF3795 domain-containing protein n=1 Tax=uncultured Parabacteroides sp. TaxID=512312 RepID=UPI002805CBC7|nr:DUF3795 domain-containing protein [uncultured Parabacteroides sp.]